MNELERETSKELRLAFFESGVLRKDVAARMGISAPYFSLILNGERPAPPDFAQDCRNAIELIQWAEAAAAKAREDVLAGGEGTHGHESTR